MDRLSWYQHRPEVSLDLLAATGISRTAAVLDVGGGASALAGELIERGFGDVTVLDVSAEALARNREQLGSRAEVVSWIEADITAVELEPARWDVWHDRAAFHFLVDPDDRDAYLHNLRVAARPGAHVVIATFAPDGPERCSGLPVQRYSAAGFAELLGPTFESREVRRELHKTPSGSEQAFIWHRFRHRGLDSEG